MPVTFVFLTIRALRKPLRDMIRANAEKLAAAAGMKIECLVKAYGDHLGLVHVISVMDACSVCKAWHDKRTCQTCLRPTAGKCHLFFVSLILSIKTEQVMYFLGKKMPTQLAQEVDAHLPRCIETTTNDVFFFERHRQMEHRGLPSWNWLPSRSRSTDLIYLCEILLGRQSLLRRTRRCQTVDDHRVKGFNFFDKAEYALLYSLQRSQFNICGVCRADLKPFLLNFSVASITRYLKPLRTLGLIKKSACAYRYRLTLLSRNTIAAACHLAEQIIVPALAARQNLLRICEKLSHKRLM